LHRRQTRCSAGAAADLHPRDPTVKQFIRNVRAAKTIADERAVIQKESASIRASFREESADHGVRYELPEEPLS
jgi:hypothetical protein